MSDDTPRLRLGQLVDGQELDAMAINDALIQLDAFTDICLKDKFVNTPPAAPVDGDTYLLGAAPAGAWSGYAYKIAYCLDGGWRFYTPFDGMRAVLLTNGGFMYYHDGTWSDFAPPPSGAEVAVASATVCDIGSPGSLCVAITGTAAITSFGTAPNALRFVRFAASLTLTHNATSLILPGAANIQTANGDTAIFASDSSGNWRCRAYTPAGGIVSASGALSSLGTTGTALAAIGIPPGRYKIRARVQLWGATASQTVEIIAKLTDTSGDISSAAASESYAQIPAARGTAVILLTYDYTNATGANKPLYLNAATIGGTGDQCYGGIVAERMF